MLEERRSAASAVLGAIAAIGVAPELGAQGAFYRASASDLIGAPGTLVREEVINPDRKGTVAYRVLYRSVGLMGEPIAVSGTIIVPLGPKPIGGRSIVAWAHPTSGIVPRCAPSLAVFKFQQIQGLRTLLRDGYIVTASDYPGLGTPGPHPYLVGVSEGRAVLDSVRAAEQLTGDAGAKVALWGHSQGGQAVLFAGVLAPTYAPELRLVGIAAAAPATELGALMRANENTPGGKNLLSMTLWSWARVYGAPIDEVVKPDALPTIEKLAKLCLESPLDLRPRARLGRTLEKGLLSVPDITELEPWRTLLTQNTIAALPREIPVFLAQGDVDAVVAPAVTRNYMTTLCKAGNAVMFMAMPNIGHGRAAMSSALTAIGWMRDRFSGAPAPNACVPS